MADEHRALAHVSERRQSTPTGRVLPPMRKARLYAIATTSVLRKSSRLRSSRAPTRCPGQRLRSSSSIGGTAGCSSVSLVSRIDVARKRGCFEGAEALGTSRSGNALTRCEKSSNAARVRRPTSFSRSRLQEPAGEQRRNSALPIGGSAESDAPVPTLEFPRKGQSRSSAAATIDGQVPIAGNTSANTFPPGHVSADGQSRLRQALRE